MVLSEVLLGVLDAAAALHADLPVRKGIFRTYPFLPIDTLVAGRIDIEPCTPTSADPHYRVPPSTAPAYAWDRAGMVQQGISGLRGSVVLVKASVVQHR